MIKTCRKCNLEKEHSYNQRWCKECFSKRYKTWHPNNREKVRANQKKNIRTLKTRFSQAKRQAIKHGKEWSLTSEEYKAIVDLPCVYCKGFFPAVETGSGLDRMDSSVGYITTNVVSCCWTCNKIKNDALSFDEAHVLISLLVRMRAPSI